MSSFVYSEGKKPRWAVQRSILSCIFFQHQHYSFSISDVFLFGPCLSPLFVPFCSCISCLPPSCFLTIHVSFLTPKCVSIFRCSSTLPLIFLPLSHLLFFLFWRTGSQKRCEIHQRCTVAAFWSAWWVTTQPQAIIYKCVFINSSLSICKSLCCAVVVCYVVGALVISKCCMLRAKFIH